MKECLTLFLTNQTSTLDASELACHRSHASVDELLLGDASQYDLDDVLCLCDALGLDSKHDVQMAFQWQEVLKRAKLGKNDELVHDDSLPVARVLCERHWAFQHKERVADCLLYAPDHVQKPDHSRPELGPCHHTAAHAVHQADVSMDGVDAPVANSSPLLLACICPV